MKTVFIAFRAGIVMALFVWAWGSVALLLRPFDERYGLKLGAWATPTSVPVMLAGAGVVLACGAAFVVKGQGTPAPFDPPRQFVAVGPYRYVRNPIYIGGLIMLAGFGLWQRSGAILLSCALWLLLFHLLVVLYEERTLRHKFGQPYEAYLRTVPRWLPRKPASRISMGAGGQW